MVKDRTFTGTEARQLLRRARFASLATKSREGGTPYASLANIATDGEGHPLLLISRLAWHTQNLEADPAASIMVAEPPPAGDVLTGPRVTVLGRFERTDDQGVRRRYLAHHPAAAMYADFGDFGFWRMIPAAIHAVAGFGRIETLEPGEVFPSASEMVELEESAVTHMNAGHADAVKRYAKSLGGDPDTDWRMTAIDCDGAGISDGSKVLRLNFSEPVFSMVALRRLFAHMKG
ncbi:MAG: HugZ family protein [Rhizobiales bacterium]|nr:HugZ family protein [Hyphomicrobiales bacterium]